MTQNDLNTLSHAIERIGFQSMDLEQTSIALANYKETEPAIVQAMLTVFSNAIYAQSEQLAELSELLESVYHSQTTDKVQA